MRKLRLLTAWELLEARAEAERCCEDAAALGLWQNACLLARAVTRWGRRPWADGAAALKHCGPEEIEAMAAQYRAMAERWDPHCGQDEAKTEAMLDKLRQMPEARIQWRVLRSFGVLPSERRARKMRRGDYLYCVLHLLLDEEERLERLCPDCRAQAESDACPVCGKQWEAGGSFDMARFEAMKGGG